jgi:hypothetical protein
VNETVLFACLLVGCRSKSTPPVDAQPTAALAFDAAASKRSTTPEITDASLAASATNDASWCLEDDLPNDVVRSPFTIDARTAVEKTRRTKHFAAVTAAHRGAFLDFGRVACPAACGDRAKRQCGFDMRLENHDPSSHATSNLVEWVYVDAVDRVLWWEEKGGWKSEPLPR